MEDQENRTAQVKQRLIEAGIRELESAGVQRFSIRKVASACGLSCAAPYKHFKDKQAFIAAIIAYINDEWRARQLAILDLYPDDTARQLTEFSLAYIRFLVDNPQYRSIIMLPWENENGERTSIKRELSELTRKIIARFCESVGMNDEIRQRKTYIVRSFIYGAALMIDNGEMDNTPETYEIIRGAIDREFRLPQ